MRPDAMLKEHLVVALCRIRTVSGHIQKPEPIRQRTGLSVDDTEAMRGGDNGRRGYYRAITRRAGDAAGRAVVRGTSSSLRGIVSPGGVFLRHVARHRWNVLSLCRIRQIRDRFLHIADCVLVVSLVLVTCCIPRRIEGLLTEGA